MAATDRGRQFFPENRKVLSIRRTNRRREIVATGWFSTLWSKENQLRESACAQPGETAAIITPAESETPIAIKTVPAQVSLLERLATHGLYRVAEERLD